MAIITKSSKPWAAEEFTGTKETILQNLRYHWSDLKAAAHGFHEDYLIGESTYASVYKGILKDGSTVAIKRLKSARNRDKNDFEADVVSMSRALHRNVAKLLGYSSTFMEKVFVFDYFQDGSLDALLHGLREGPSPFDWDSRKAMLVGIAEGLHYLHTLTPSIVHGALKSCNVMLDADMVPKLVDYHMGHPVIRKRPTKIPDIEWAMGYMAPELGVKTELPSVKSDCYSFGFLLLEVVSGSRPWRLLTSANDANLTQKDWVKMSFTDLQTLVDPSMLSLPSHTHPPMWEVKKMMELCVMCMDEQPSRRPSMADVMHYFREEALITSRSSETGELFIELDVGASAHMLSNGPGSSLSVASRAKSRNDNSDLMSQASWAPSELQTPHQGYGYGWKAQDKVGTNERALSEFNSSESSPRSWSALQTPPMNSGYAKTQQEKVGDDLIHRGHRNTEPVPPSFWSSSAIYR